MDIARQRLRNQHLARPQFDKPSDVVAWLGAVQAQDYLGALWALGLRTTAANQGDIERAIADRTIVRTWPLRGTLHFVAPGDVRWMLKYLASRVVARSALRQKQLELDEAVIARSTKLFVGALEGGRQLTRGAMYALLEAARISTGSGRGLHILWRIAHDGVICFGTRQGRQHTFTLLDEWVPRAARMPERDEALAELARRYFTSRGPATLHDFGWWSGLSSADARSALEMARPHLLQARIDGQLYWLSWSSSATAKGSRSFLLPAFDEYTVAYRDRSAVVAAKYATNALSPTIVIDGQVVGTWTRAFQKDTLVVTPRPFRKLGDAGARAVSAAARRYRRFLAR